MKNILENQFSVEVSRIRDACATAFGWKPNLQLLTPRKSNEESSAGRIPKQFSVEVSKISPQARRMYSEMTVPNGNIWTRQRKCCPVSLLYKSRCCRSNSLNTYCPTWGG